MPHTRADFLISLAHVPQGKGHRHIELHSDASAPFAALGFGGSLPCVALECCTAQALLGIEEANKTHQSLLVLALGIRVKTSHRFQKREVLLR